jgi:beta-glucosidase
VSRPSAADTSFPRVYSGVAGSGQLLDDPEAEAVLVEDLPQLFTHPMLNVSLGMVIDSAVTMVAADMDPEARRRLVSRLAAL